MGKQHCNICGDRPDEPYYCVDCGLYARNKPNSFVYQVVNAINKIGDYSAWIDNFSSKHFVEPIKDGRKLMPLTYEEKRQIAFLRRGHRRAVSTLIDIDLLGKARVEIAIFEVIKAMGEAQGVTRKQIDEVVKISPHRYTRLNKLLGNNLTKIKNEYIYGKKEIEMLLQCLC